MDDVAVIKRHQWFAGFDWGGLQAGEYFNQVLKKVFLIDKIMMDFVKKNQG